MLRVQGDFSRILQKRRFLKGPSMEYSIFILNCSLKCVLCSPFEIKGWLFILLFSFRDSPCPLSKTIVELTFHYGFALIQRKSNASIKIHRKVSQNSLKDAKFKSRTYTPVREGKNFKEKFVSLPPRKLGRKISRH